MPVDRKQLVSRLWRRLPSLPRLALFCLLLNLPAELAAAELVMFEEPGCPWCAAWTEEVGVVYDKTAEGRRAPLRRVDMTGPRPADLQGVEAIVFSPTFVLVERGVEVGRITGYPGEHFFWPMLQDLLARLEDGPES